MWWKYIQVYREGIQARTHKTSLHALLSVKAQMSLLNGSKDTCDSSRQSTESEGIACAQVWRGTAQA
jgi:hypothetical protein